MTPYQYHSMTDNVGLWGTLDITVGSVMRTGATATITSAEVSVYGHWEDVELFAPLIPQGRNKMSVTRRREVFASGKPVSESLTAVGTIATHMAKIPVLGGAMSGVAWAANILSGTASAMGFAKPVLDTVPMITTARNMPYAHLSQGPDTAQPLGNFASDMVAENSDFSVTEEDEMSLAYLQKIPNYVGNFQWTTSQAAGTILLEQQITPSLFGVTRSQSVGGHIAVYAGGGPLRFLSNYFKLWRGSIRAHIRLVKTEFHRGRLQIVWSPNLDRIAPTPAVTTTNSLYSVRRIVDICDQQEIIIDLPWLIYPEYLSTQDDGSTPWSSGKLTISVLNQLRAPDTCSLTVDMIHQYVGGDDFEFQVPSVGPSIFIPQSDTRIISMMPKGREMPSRSLDHATRCISESIQSLKQVINRSAQWGRIGSTSATNNVIAPWAFTAGSISGIGNLVSGGNAGFYQDPMSIVANMYAFCSGSVTVSAGVSYNLDSTFFGNIPGAIQRYALATTGSTTAQVWVMPKGTTTSIVPIVNPAATYGTLSQTPQRAGFSSSINNWGVLATGFNVPYMSRYPVSFVQVADGVHNLSVNYGVCEDTHPLGCVYTDNNSTVLSYGINRYAGDDFRFHYFIGAPPILLSYT